MQTEKNKSGSARADAASAVPARLFAWRVRHCRSSWILSAHAPATAAWFCASKTGRPVEYALPSPAANANARFDACRAGTEISSGSVRLPEGFVSFCSQGRSALASVVPRRDARRDVTPVMSMPIETSGRGVLMEEQARGGIVLCSCGGSAGGVIVLDICGGSAGGVIVLDTSGGSACEGLGSGDLSLGSC